MGEIAEAMLDGTLCGTCGSYLGTDNGFPTYCRGCDPFEAEPAPRKRGPSAKPKPCVCGDCGKQFKSKGARRHHRRRVHPQVTRASSAPAESNSASVVEARAGGES